MTDVSLGKYHTYVKYRLRAGITPFSWPLPLWIKQAQMRKLIRARMVRTSNAKPVINRVLECT